MSFCISRTVWKASKYGVFPGPYFPVIGLNTAIYNENLRIQSEYGKTRTRKNSVFGHFSHSDNVFLSQTMFLCLSLLFFCTRCQNIDCFSELGLLIYVNEIAIAYKIDFFKLFEGMLFRLSDEKCNLVDQIFTYYNYGDGQKNQAWFSLLTCFVKRVGYYIGNEAGSLFSDSRSRWC